MTALATINYAAKRIGYNAGQDPLPGSESGRWLAKKLGQPWLAGPSRSIWWCMCFASMCVYEPGGTMPGGPTYNTDLAIRAARAENRFVPVSSMVAGDLPIFRWKGANAGGPTDHVGIFVKWVDRGRGLFETIEGNTTPGTAGSQSAGNGVWRRVRSVDHTVGAVRPYYTNKPTQKEGFLMALSDAEQAKVAARIKNIQDILTGYAPNPYVAKGANLPLVGARVRDIKDYVSGGGPRGEDDTRLTEILAKLEGIEQRLTKIEGK